ncbi:MULTISPECIES: SPOR domain-containing protein [unclassified Acinetobacter]|uniref:SPOR domain-containing protein n=1 Tax=unclassified Acinetobacter TaxID=196816 RepID=UPI0015D380A2|nr:MULTISPECIES: SPOR domain-containing protein [unclassified Acinetobacter]
MNNKQRWMGGVVLLGGGVLLAALLLKGKEEIHQNQSQTPEIAQVEQQGQGAGKMSSLTVDVETEKRLLEEQRRTREKSVAEQEARAAEFLAMQQQAEADAARKAAEEYAALNAHRSAQQSSDNIPPELVEDEKAKQKRLAEDKLAAQKKLETQSAQQKADQARIAADKQKAEAKRKADAQKEAERKAHAEAEKKAADKKAAEAKQQAEEKRKAEEKHKAEEKRKAEAKKKAEAEKARDLLENGDKQWMVQVALAANEANADAVAAKLRAKGYKVTKSPTSKGIRIMVGPSKDRDAADATRKKINSDASLNMKSAWVIDWVPLDKR